MPYEAILVDKYGLPTDDRKLVVPDTSPLRMARPKESGWNAFLVGPSSDTIPYDIVTYRFRTQIGSVLYFQED